MKQFILHDQSYVQHHDWSIITIEIHYIFILYFRHTLTLNIAYQQDIYVHTRRMTLMTYTNSVRLLPCAFRSNRQTAYIE